MSVTPWLANYPFSDPIFQNFEVQQYLQIAGVNPVTTYDAPAPKELSDEKAAENAAVAGEGHVQKGDK